jgi:hypothetical protein
MSRQVFELTLESVIRMVQQSNTLVDSPKWQLDHQQSLEYSSEKVCLNAFYNQELCDS